MAATDEALLAGLAVGDTGAGAAFVRRFQHRVYGLAFTVVGDGALAEDIAQEAFARAWRHATVYDARRGSVATWLLAITRNLSIDALRIRRAEPVPPEALVALEQAVLAGSPEDDAMTSAEMARVRDALARLPGDQRHALVLATFFGCTAREIAEAQGIPLGTAKTRLRSALLKLRSDLGAQETPT